MASPAVARLPPVKSGVVEPIQVNPGASAEEAASIYQSEEDIMEKAEKFKEDKNFDGFDKLITGVKGFVNNVSKAKAAKLVRSLVDMYLELNPPHKQQVDVCQGCINWATSEKRTFLRQSLEARLVGVHYENEDYREAIEVGGKLLKELKKVDDKNLLVEVQLLESKTYHALGNLPRARAALTSARTTANSIYCAPVMQAALDLQSGILHAADEKDFKTAYSYFYEAFEGLDGMTVDKGNPKAMVALKYMLLSKTMLNLPEEVFHLLSSPKLSLRYKDYKELEAMRAIAESAHKRSLSDFQAATKKYNEELGNDVVVKAHLATLYDKMMEQNLCRIIEPYSKVQVDYVAKTIGLPQRNVEQKLSQMILDKKLAGVLDQGQGLLVIFESNEEDKAYEAALGLVQNMGKVVDALYHKAKNIT